MPILRAYHAKAGAGLWLLGMLVIAMLSTQALTKDWLETGFLALLPPAEQRPEIAEAVRRHNELNNRKVIWLAGAESTQQAVTLAGELKRQLQQSALFSRVLMQLPQQAYIDQYRQLFPYRYHLLDGQTRRMLDNDPQALIDQNLEMLYSPIGQMQAAALERDPLLLSSRYFNSQNPFKFKLEQGIVMLHDGHYSWALLLSDLQDAHLQLDKLEQLLALADTASAHIEAAGGRLMVSGMPLFTARGAQSAKQEISTVGIGSSLGIMVLLLATFRSPRPLLLSSLAIGSGLFAALIICILFFGKIHLLTLVFGASLIGVADDYAQHFLCDSLGVKNWEPSKGLRFILPGLAIGLLSNLLSYAGLGFSPFPGLQQIALFSASGLLVAWLTVVLLFPLLLTGFTFDHQPGLLKWTGYWEQRWPAWAFKNRHGLALLLVALIGGGIWQLRPQDNVRLLQSTPAELTDTADKIRQLFPVSRDSQFFLVSGKNQDDWYRNEQRLLENLEPLKQRHALEYYEGISGFWPDARKQGENYSILKRVLYDSGLLSRYMSNLGFTEATVKAELQQFIAVENNRLTLPEWLKTADEGKRQLWLGCDSASGCQSIVALSGIKNGSALSGLQDLPGVSWVDQVGQLSSLFARYRVRAGAMLAAACAIILAGLALRFGWRDALKISSVPVTAAALALAMLGWFGQLFSLFNLFALLLVLGIGVDYAVFFYIAGHKRASASLAVTLSALTTLLAFGLLAVSKTELVHAFGFTVAAGIVTALISAPLLGRSGRR